MLQLTCQSFAFTVITPILSSMGIQVCPVPTTILSTHTGGLQTPVFLDLTDYVSQSLAHYRQIGVGQQRA